jgi:hypothetical protein
MVRLQPLRCVCQLVAAHRPKSAIFTQLPRSSRLLGLMSQCCKPREDWLTPGSFNSARKSRAIATCSSISST